MSSLKCNSLFLWMLALGCKQKQRGGARRWRHVCCSRPLLEIRSPARSIFLGEFGARYAMFRVWKIPIDLSMNFMISACPIDFKHGPMVTGFAAVGFRASKPHSRRRNVSVVVIVMFCSRRCSCVLTGRRRSRR